ncbi:MAG: flagellar biosynthetic protein FliO [Actinomycetota bacterium]|nr:flagellar biosynthetic protein FliO [Actinomycetota bacterium]
MTAGLGVFLRSAISLAVVIALMYLLARLARRFNAKGAQAGGPPASISIESRVGVGKGQTIASVSWGGRSILVGITPQNISLIAEGHPAPLQTESEGAYEEFLDLRASDDPLEAMLTKWGEGNPSTAGAMPFALRTELKRLLGARR